MAERGISAFLGDLVLEALNHAILDRLHFVAGAADQVVMMMMAVLRADFVPGRAIDPRDTLDQFFIFENRDEAEDGGEVAAFRAHLFVDVGQGKRNRAGVEQAHNGDAAVCRTQAVLPQPRGGVDGVRCPMFAHDYL